MIIRLFSFLSLIFFPIFLQPLFATELAIAETDDLTIGEKFAFDTGVDPDPPKPFPNNLLGPGEPIVLDLNLSSTAFTPKPCIDGYSPNPFSPIITESTSKLVLGIRRVTETIPDIRLRDSTDITNERIQTSRLELAADSNPQASSVCNDQWDYNMPDPLWLDVGSDWTDPRRQRVNESMDKAIRWLESFVQQLDVIENGEEPSWLLYWSVLPAQQIALDVYFGELNGERFRVIRERAHRMLLIMTEQNPYNVLRIKAGDNEVGTCADGFDAWSRNGEIGFCLPTLDDEESWPLESMAGLLLHEIAHRAGAGHATAYFCTGGLDDDECRSESQTIQLAEEDPDLSVNNADSYRFSIMRHGQIENWCHPQFTQYYTGAGWGGTGAETESVSGFQLCTPQDPFNDQEFLCRNKLWTNGSPYCDVGQGLVGSNTFKWCD